MCFTTNLRFLIFYYSQTDNSGEIKAAVHKRVLDKYGAFLKPGSGLLLRQCTIFSFISIQKYINITLPNIVHIFNSSSLIAPPESVDRHVLEVNQLLVALFYLPMLPRDLLIARISVGRFTEVRTYNGPFLLKMAKIVSDIFPHNIHETYMRVNWVN